MDGSSDGSLKRTHPGTSHAASGRRPPHHRNFEYILGWLPKGTHQWEKFITPEELKGWLTENGVAVKDETGVTYTPLKNEWRKSRDMDVNYMVVGVKES